MSARPTLAGFAAAALLLGAGCGEDASQRSAREALQGHLGTLPDTGGYDRARVHCSRAGRVYFDAVRTTRFLCTAQRADGGDCDWFRVDLADGGRAHVLLVRRGAGCVLPGT
jgi:hypothetical protein